ncbi:MAG: biotin transporter BioY [Oscillospiraceae bacterium]|jgi:biotin transport system substrate-specific component|nr:biotin transporter BioY [Oscillospiraceae bacterium]
MKLREMLRIALFAALICVLAPFSIGEPIPVTLATFAIYLSAATLGPASGTIAVVLYVLLGAVGLPVFANSQGGVQKLVSSTGGYIIGYVPLAFITGLFANIKSLQSKRFSFGMVLGMVLGTVVLYALGTAWFVRQSGARFSYALAVCVVPFLIGDALKIVGASALAPILRREISHRRK